jgi:hypothetical protein
VRQHPDRTLCAGKRPTGCAATTAGCDSERQGVQRHCAKAAAACASVGQRAQRCGQSRIAGLVGGDDVLLLRQAGAQGGDQASLTGRGAR